MKWTPGTKRDNVQSRWKKTIDVPHLEFGINRRICKVCWSISNENNCTSFWDNRTVHQHFVCRIISTICWNMDIGHARHVRVLGRISFIMSDWIHRIHNPNTHRLYEIPVSARCGDVCMVESLSSNQFPIIDGNLLMCFGLMNINCTRGGWLTHSFAIANSEKVKQMFTNVSIHFGTHTYTQRKLMFKSFSICNRFSLGTEPTIHIFASSFVDFRVHTFKIEWKVSKKCVRARRRRCV